MERNSLEKYVSAQVAWYGQSIIRITGRDGTVVWIDPFKVIEAAPKADLVLYTHPHRDHYTPRGLASVRKPGTRIVAPKGMGKLATDPLEPGESRSIAGILVRAVPAYNARGFPHAPGSGWLGYVVGIDGVSIYHPGDTDVIPDFSGAAPDIAFLPVVGLVTLKVEKAVEAARRLGAGITIPIHYGMLPGTANRGERFVRAYDGPAMLLRERAPG